MTIAEVAKKYELTPDTLRYYERMGLIPDVGRTGGGIRNYTDEDCRWVEFIKCMRGAGLPIDTLAEYVRLFGLGDSTLGERKELLVTQRGILAARISELQATLDRLDRKIERYEQWAVPAENELKR